jgi:hypothetical protein
MNYFAMERQRSVKSSRLRFLDVVWGNTLLNISGSQCTIRKSAMLIEK